MTPVPALLLLACSQGPVSFTSPDQCRTMEAGPARDECWAAMAPELFRQDPTGAEQVVIEQVQDPKVLDFIWLTVTREVDPGSNRWCEKIQDPAIGARCRTLVSRPHLHRALQQERGQQPGGPPQGGPGPQGGPPPGGLGPQGALPPGQAPQGPPPGQAPQGPSPTPPATP